MDNVRPLQRPHLVATPKVAARVATGGSLDDLRAAGYKVVAPGTTSAEIEAEGKIDSDTAAKRLQAFGVFAVAEIDPLIEEANERIAAANLEARIGQPILSDMGLATRNAVTDIKSAVGYTKYDLDSIARAFRMKVGSNLSALRQVDMPLMQELDLIFTEIADKMKAHGRQ